MKFREKLKVQIVVTLVIFCCICCVKAVDNDFTQIIKDKAGSLYSESYTGEELMELCSNMGSKVISAGKKLPGIVSEANNRNLYNAPVSETPDEGVFMVYADSDGMVETVGISKELGMHMVISHDDGRTSVYGNLAQMTVVPEEKVRRGDLIGTYLEENEKEFYYSLEESK